MASRAWCALFWTALLCGCRPAATPVEFPTPARWQSPTASPSYFFPTRAVSLTPTPAPSPTPQTYTVKAGDTFGSIAAKFGVTVDALIQANPGVDPNALPIGQVLVIPVRPAGSETPPPSPTPVSLELGPPYCYPQPSGGKWCLAMVGNPGPDPVSGLILRFSLYASPEEDAFSALDTAFPLFVLPAGRRTAAAVFFPPELAQPEIARVELASAVRTTEALGILPAVVTKETAVPRSDGIELTVEFRIDAEDGAAATRVDAVLVLLDSLGRPVGFRIWHGQGEWPPGPTHTLTLDAFVLAGRMDSYEFILQARGA
ncbi:MAG: LysM peptidoglycan-binding domain-containing protein [Anaerolineales bacterium]|nr:LysM peptidoglycan-binding domain-containing protein [Anaerolineales bacterium]